MVSDHCIDASVDRIDIWRLFLSQFSGGHVWHSGSSLVLFDLPIFVHIFRVLYTFLHAKKKLCVVYKGVAYTKLFLHDLCTMH